MSSSESSSPAPKEDDENEEIKESQVLPESQTAKSTWQDYFSKMMNDLSDDYMKRVMELANNDNYEISLRVPTGNKMKDPFSGEEVDEFKGWEKKRYSRGRITAADYNKVEKLRAQYQKEKDPEKIADMLARIYQFLAYCFLEMSYNEFIRTDWDEVKPVLDACNFRTVYSLKNSKKL